MVARKSFSYSTNDDKNEEECNGMHTLPQNKMTIADLLMPKRDFGCIDSNLVLISLICFLADTVTGENPLLFLSMRSTSILP